MDTQAPQGEYLNVVVDIILIKILIVTVQADVLLAGIPAREDIGKGGNGILCEDGIAKGRGRDEGMKSFKVGNTPNRWGSGEGPELVDCGAVDVGFGGTNHME